MKLNLGCGLDVRRDYVNVDVANIRGVDVVHNLELFPWPFEENSIDGIIALDVIEHLDDFIGTMEEMYRILKDGSSIRLRVPYYNSWSRYVDPTHKRGFHELTFRYFDPNSVMCIERPYYTKARFKIVEEHFILIPFSPYLTLPLLKKIKVSNSFFKKILSSIANHIGSVIIDIELVLVALK